MTTLMLASSCPPRKTKHGTHRTTRMTKKRTRPLLHILERSLSSSLLPRPRFHIYRFPNHLQEKHSLALQPCPFFLFPPDATRLPTRLWPISPCVVEVPPSPCYHLARLPKKRVGAFGRSHALQITTFLSSSTGNQPLLLYPLHPSQALQTRPLQISPLLNHLLTVLPFYLASGQSRGGVPARDAPRALVPVTPSLPVSNLAKTRHPAPLHRNRLHPARPAGFFGLPTRLIRRPDPRPQD